jgi:hypothetical protein
MYFSSALAQTTLSTPEMDAVPRSSLLPVEVDVLLDVAPNMESSAEYGSDSPDEINRGGDSPAKGLDVQTDIGIGLGV